MDLTWLLIASLIINIGFMLVIRGQSKEIKFLKNKVKEPNQAINDEAFTNSVREKLATDGMVKTVKYVREEKGMDLVEAKQFVDRLEN